MDAEHNEHEGDEASLSARVGAQIETDACEEERRFDQEGKDRSIPQTEPDLRGVVIKRQVGDVNDDDEDPVREDRKRDQQGGSIFLTAKLTP